MKRICDKEGERKVKGDKRGKARYSKTLKIGKRGLEIKKRSSRAQNLW